MKVLYITSGFPGIYQFFDNCIVNEMNNDDHICKSFNHFQGIDSLKLIVLKFEPDLVFTLTGFILPKEMTDWLRSKNIKLAVWMTEDPYYMDTSIGLASHYDYVFTIDSSSLEVYREKGHPNVYLLPLGTDPNIFSPKPNVDEQQINDICLVGYPYPERIDIINLLLKETSYTVQVVGGNWKDNLLQWSENKQLKIIDWSPPDTVAYYYNNAKIILNTHRPHDLAENQNSMGIINSSINNRTFDVAASGAFQLISYKPDLRNYFTEEEMVSFQKEEDLLNKIDHFMKHKEERKKIAVSAREKVLNQHTFLHRTKEIISTVKESGIDFLA
ncbi:glycosyltransferase [Metabacillus herbersteinensis]|uniref:Glycosyltransferase n=1 Tax=Metabacillus herbersteinensis TaxID=283816 RepID=A0ABV6GFE9_9BACI